MKAAWLVPALLLASPALAGSVTVMNGGGETIRQIIIAPALGSGDNRLRSNLPPGAQARIGYSTGCQAAVRVVYDSGRSEDFASVDPCTDPHITSGSGGGTAGPVVAAAPGTKPAATQVGAKTAAPGTTASSMPVKAPPPVVPPWTGKSITKRFGGMD